MATLPKRQKKKHHDELEIGDQVCEVGEMTMCKKCYSTDVVGIVFEGTMPCPRSMHCCPHCLSSASEFFREVLVIHKREFVLSGLDRNVWFWLYDPFILKLGGGEITPDRVLDLIPFFSKLRMNDELQVCDQTLAGTISDSTLESKGGVWDWNSPEAEKLDAISSTIHVLFSCKGWETSLPFSLRKGLASLEMALKHSYIKFTVKNFVDLTPLIGQAFGNVAFDSLYFGSDLSFLSKFVGRHLQHVENGHSLNLCDKYFPYILHTAIRLSFASKQRDRAKREMNEAIRDRDAAVQEKEALLGDIRAAIGRYN